MERIAFSSDGQLTRYAIEAPIIVILPITLINADIFPETLTGVSLVIEKPDTGNFEGASLMLNGSAVEIGKKRFELPAIRMSQDELVSRKEDGRAILNPATLFSEQILNRGTEKHFNFFFYTKPPLTRNIDDALLGWLTPATYKLTLELRKRKLRRTTERINMEVDFTEPMYRFFWHTDNPVVAAVTLEEGASLFRILAPSKSWYQFWKK